MANHEYADICPLMTRDPRHPVHCTDECGMWAIDNDGDGYCAVTMGANALLRLADLADALVSDTEDQA